MVLNLGYEVYYNTETKTWSIYSTISMDFIKSSIKTPEEVARFIIKGPWFVSVDGGRWVTFVSEKEAKEEEQRLKRSYPDSEVRAYKDKAFYQKTFRGWVKEAIKAKRDAREYVEYMEFPSGRMGVKRVPS